jgi:hypothetical protein
LFQAKKFKIGGNLKGDGYQNGGTVVVGAGGKVLFSYTQDQPSDHADPADILKALGIEAGGSEGGAGAGAGAAGAEGAGPSGGVVCEEDVCRKT